MSHEAGAEVFKEIGARVIALTESMDDLRSVWFKNQEASKAYGPTIYGWFKGAVNARKAEILAHDAQPGNEGNTA